MIGADLVEPAAVIRLPHGGMLEVAGAAGSPSCMSLEEGTFTFPARVTEGVASIAIDVHELAILLEGII